MSLTFSVLREEEYEYWNGLVLSSKHASIFHTTLFLEALQKPFVIGLIKKMDSPVMGFISAYSVTSKAKKTLRPPFVPYEGIVFFGDQLEGSTFYQDTLDGYKLLIHFFRKEFDTLSLRLSPQITDIQAFIWERFDVRIRYTYVLDISDLTVCWKRFDSNRKRNIKAAEKAGVNVKLHKPLQEYASLFRATRGEPGNYAALLEEYDKRLRAADAGTTIIIEDNTGKPLAGVWVAWDHHRAYYLLGGYNSSDESNQSFTTFALWHAMQYCRLEKNVMIFDLEGSMIPGVETFFRKFGGKKLPYYQIVLETKGIMYYLKKVIRKILGKWKIK